MYTQLSPNVVVVNYSVGVCGIYFAYRLLLCPVSIKIFTFICCMAVALKSMLLSIVFTELGLPSHNVLVLVYLMHLFYTSYCHTLIRKETICIK